MRFAHFYSVCQACALGRVLCSGSSAQALQVAFESWPELYGLTRVISIAMSGGVVTGTMQGMLEWLAFVLGFALDGPKHTCTHEALPTPAGVAHDQCNALQRSADRLRWFCCGVCAVFRYVLRPKATIPFADPADPSDRGPASSFPRCQAIEYTRK